MDKIIRLSKCIELNQNIQIPEQQSLYNTLVNELKVGISGHNLVNSTWELHKNQNTSLYQSLTTELNRVASGLLQRGNNLKETIEARNKIMIPLEFAYLTVDDYDWQNQATITIYLKSIELVLLESLGSALLLRVNQETNQTFVVDLEDKSISIPEYTQK
jgi:hypothetical protein